MYLTNILNKYKTQFTPTQSIFIETLKNELAVWASGCFREITFSGSTAKGTSIAIASDLDLFISLTNDCHQNDGGLSKIYESLYQTLDSKYSKARRQRVSVGIEACGLKIDITPGRKLFGNTSDHNLHLTKGGKYIQTNIQKHISDIKYSGRINEIKLLKIWRHLNEIDFPSIYLEYLTIEILRGRHSAIGNLENNFLYLLNQLANCSLGNPIYSRLVDPSNTNNELSDLISKSDKEKIVASAIVSSSAKNWQDIVW